MQAPDEPGWRDPPASLARRDRLATLISLAGVVGLAWLYVVLMAIGMEEMGAMGGMSGPAGTMTMRPWAALDFGLIFAMWAVMMVGMMVPSATPTALIYVAVARRGAREESPLSLTAVFVVGYVTMWTVFSLVATVSQWGLERAALLSPMMVSTSPALGAALLIGAGIYQLTPMKAACLRHCRAPVQFISEEWRPGRAGALHMGIIHGAYCVSCCWILMGLLFFGGVMNLLWIAGITAFVLAEHVLPFAVWGGRIAGGAMIPLGVAVLAGWSFS